MSDHEQVPGGLSRDKLRRLLEVSRDLARPFDLTTMLYAVVDAAKELLDAEAGTVWRYHPEANEMELRVARGLDPIRIPADRGIVGECVRTRALINVPDCYADPRFNRDIDKSTGRKTRCMLTLPLVGYDDQLVGVLQVLNRRQGVFDADDEALADALAGQCAVALQRVQLTEQLVAAETLRQEIAVAREVQMGALPKVPPVVEGYELVGLFQPTDDTGGDIYDFVACDDGRVFLLMGDATGHGIGPALSAVQVRAMLRIAQRLGAGLDEVFRQINDQLLADLPEDRFVTAFLGLLDPLEHRLHYHSGGQGPLLHFRPTGPECDFFPPTTFPLGAVPLPRLAPPRTVELEPGDVFALISDGVYEFEDAQGRQFGEQGVTELLSLHHRLPLPALLSKLQQALADFAQGAPQLDDVTVVLLRRNPALPEAEPMRVATGHGAAREFARSFDQLPAIFDFIQTTLPATEIGDDDRYAIEFGAEEIFTNMVKYNPAGGGAITIDIQCGFGVIDCVLTDPDSDYFDVSAAPDVDVGAPASARRPGGLGLHLVRRLVDSLDYDYSGRRSRISLRRTLGKR